MCGRFTLTAPAEALHELFPLFDFSSFAPRYNVAPSQSVAVVRHNPDSHQPELTAMRWGLIPSWADDAKIGYRLINARSDSAATKPAFRSAFKKRRCLVLADGFFEWQKAGKHKQPYWIRRKDGKPFAFAGLWEHWTKGEKPIDSCTVLTTDANAVVRPLHDRMPVILEQSDFERWLAAQPGQFDEELLRPAADDRLTAQPVNERVNNARVDDAACIAPAEVSKLLF
jgi:putative SOS response-associated peptidase YedK